MQEKAVINLVVRRLLLNYMARPQFPYTTASYAIFTEGNQPGVLQRVGSAAGNITFIFIYLCYSEQLDSTCKSLFNISHRYII